MKRISCLLFLIFAGVLGCGSGGSAESLASKLRGQTFLLQADSSELEEALAEGCGEEFTAAGSDLDALVISPGPFLAAQDEEEVVLFITFATTTYTVKDEDGEVVDTGSWRAVDGNTIAVASDGGGEEVELDVIVSGNTLTVNLTDEQIDDLVTAACSPGGGGGSTDVNPTPDVSPGDDGDDSDDGSESGEQEADTLASALAGTWCYESGFPYYLAIELDTTLDPSATFASYQASAAYVAHNQPFLDGETDQLVFVNRTVGINEVYQTAWIATFSVGGSEPGVVPFATIAFLDEDREALRINFGSAGTADYFRSPSAGVTACPAPPPDLAVSPPSAANVATRLAADLLIDGSIHTGTDWNGAPYEGVWGEPFYFKMDDYPLSWAISLVHASLLLRSRGIAYSPNAVLSVAIKESRLGCLETSFPNNDGCFQIEATTAYAELTALFPDRFSRPHSEVISRHHFESSALAMVYYNLFSMSLFYLHSDDPFSFFESHPDPQAQQKMISAAYNRGLWWQGLTEAFSACADREVTDCFLGHQIAIDHALAIADYTKGLEAEPPFNTSVTEEDLLNYWETIRPLYGEVNTAAVQSFLIQQFEEIRGGNQIFSFQDHLPLLLERLIAFLPSLPTQAAVTAAVCARGYLWQSPPCA